MVDGVGSEILEKELAGGVPACAQFPKFLTRASGDPRDHHGANAVGAAFGWEKIDERPQKKMIMTGRRHLIFRAFSEGVGGFYWLPELKRARSGFLLSQK